MSDPLEDLLLAAEQGEEGASARLAAALERVDDETLERLVQHRASDVRGAVARALPGRPGERAAAIALRLTRDTAETVRCALAEALAHQPAWGEDELLRTLLDDALWQVRLAVVAPAAEREELRDALLIALVEDSDDDVRARLCALLAEREPVRALPGLIENLGRPDANPRRAAALALDELIRRNDGLPVPTALPARAIVQAALGGLREIGRRRFARVVSELERRAQDSSGVELPGQRGTDLSREARAGHLERAFDVEPELAALRAVIEGNGPRAALLLGESGVGKTAIVHELTRRLASDPQGPWLVARLSPSDFLVGTSYLGEWQTELQKLVVALSSSRRTLLYVPSAHQLAQVGSSSKSDDSVASMLAPHIESGALAVIGESTQAELETGFGRSTALRRAWQTIQVRPASRARTLSILRQLCDEARAPVEDALLERVLDMSEMFSPSAAQPGRAAGLLRRVLSGLSGAKLSAREVLAELNRSSGVPADLLDDDVPLDLARLRADFEARVMGQPDALDAVVDVVTLIKAGLTDPHKPLAVLLFVGPTGVGKTELARALAERIFGDPARLLRFDMSEFASPDSFERLIGARGGSGLLTGAVKEQPFSVVLLDEIEKAHASVFDLCLQLFDAGRLTDGAGRTVDFRRTILILTSNVGAAVATDARLGFAGGGPAAPGDDEVLRALREFFRPEFLNRLDRVVTFRPLGPETAERIARRELAAVLERGGIERRGLALDLDPALIALLLREGYNRALGARPLKRTIERLVLLPVARAIASGAAQPGAVLRLSVVGSRVDVRVLQPEPGEARETPEPERASALRLRERCARLVEQAELHERGCGRLAERKSALVAATNERGFWDRRADALRTLDELHRVEGLLAMVERLARRARSTAEQALRAKEARAAAELEERAAELEHDSRLAGALLASNDPRDLGDAWVVLTQVKAQGGQLGGVEKLGRMYVEWARRRAFEVEVASDRVGGDPREDSLALVVRGPGAYGLLAGEDGLHVLQTLAPPERGQRPARTLREVVRVDVLCALEPDEERPVELRALESARGRLLDAPALEVRATHSQSSTSITLWTDAERAVAIERANGLLASRLSDERGPGAQRHEIVRRYELAPGARARGRGLAVRLHRVFAGELDALLRGPAPAAR